MTEKNNETYLNIKEKLNEVSPSFCLAKWNQVTLHLQNGRTHSCHHPPTHFIPIEELKSNASALHNTNHKKEQRKKMLEGERPSECNYCWDIEDLPGNQTSDRYIKSQDPSWNNKEDIQKISHLDWNANINPSYIEVSFSNKCNLKCTYCSPVHSTKWVQEIKKHGPYKLFHNRELNSLDYLKETNQMPFELEEDESSPYVEAFWKWWPEAIKNLKVFRITGGEPLLDKSTFRILDELIKSPISELEFSINTNACAPDELIEKFIIKMETLSNLNTLKKIIIFTSVDGYGEAAEYGRTGLDYKIWQKNIEKFLTRLPNIQLSIMFTTNIFSVTTLDIFNREMLALKNKYYSQNRVLPIVIDFNILRYPGFLNISLLPKKFSEDLQKTLHFLKENNFEKNHSLKTGFCNFEIIKFKRLIDFLNDGPDKGPDYNEDVSKADLYLFLNQLDTRRNTDFLKTFPELKDFHEECKIKNSDLIKKFHSSIKK